MILNQKDINIQRLNAEVTLIRDEHRDL